MNTNLRLSRVVGRRATSVGVIPRDHERCTSKILTNTNAVGLRTKTTGGWV